MQKSEADGASKHGLPFRDNINDICAISTQERTFNNKQCSKNVLTSLTADLPTRDFPSPKPVNKQMQNNCTKSSMMAHTD